jgi:hypothetical protein
VLTVPDFTHTASDTAPALRLQFKDANGNPQDLTGYTCSAVLRSLESGAVVTLPLVPDSPQTGTSVGWSQFSAWTGSEFSQLGEYMLVGKAVAGSTSIHYPDGSDFLTAKIARAPETP